MDIETLRMDEEQKREMDIFINSAKKKTISDASTSELHAVLDRLRLEQQVEETLKYLNNNANPGARYNDDLPPQSVDASTPINLLYHHGIRGQKWGVRRKHDESRGTGRATGGIQPSEDHIQSRNDRLKSTLGLSNAELRRLNERLQLEKAYRDLSAAEIKRNESYFGPILKDIAKQGLTALGKDLISGVGKKVLVDRLVKNIK